MKKTILLLAFAYLLTMQNAIAQSTEKTIPFLPALGNAQVTLAENNISDLDLSHLLANTTQVETEEDSTENSTNLDQETAYNGPLKPVPFIPFMLKYPGFNKDALLKKDVEEIEPESNDIDTDPETYVAKPSETYIVTEKGDAPWSPPVGKERIKFKPGETYGGPWNLWEAERMHPDYPFDMDPEYNPDIYEGNTDTESTLAETKNSETKNSTKTNSRARWTANIGVSYAISNDIFNVKIPGTHVQTGIETDKIGVGLMGQYKKLMPWNDTRYEGDVTHEAIVYSAMATLKFKVKKFFIQGWLGNQWSTRETQIDKNTQTKKASNLTFGVETGAKFGRVIPSVGWTVTPDPAVVVKLSISMGR